MYLNAGIAVVGLWLAHTIYKIFYNAFFHPLSCFPGPPMARISRWWLYRKEMRGDSHITIQELHKIHGNVVRIAPNELSIIDQKAMAAIYGQGSKFMKAKYFYRAFENHASNLFTICDKDAHSLDKRLMSNSFSHANILRHEAMISTKVTRLISRLKDLASAGKPIPLVSVFRCLTIDTITEFCYGKPIGALETENFECSQFVAFDIVTPGVPFFQHFPFLRQMLRWVSDYELPFVPGGIREMEKGAEAGLAVTRSQDMKNDKGITMFQDMLTSASNRNVIIDDASLISEGILMNFAGTDTTAATLAIGLYNLCKRPELYLELQCILRQDTRDAGSRLDYLRLESNKLLDACLKESLRLACPVSGRLPREVPADGWYFEGRRIPAGTIVGGSPFYECHDESIFPNPSAFLPERWLVDDTSEMLRYFHPFSRGTRQCIGQNLTMIEQRIAFAEFVLNFRPLEIVDKSPSIRQFITIVIDTDLAVMVGVADELLE